MTYATSLYEIFFYIMSATSNAFFMMHISTSMFTTYFHILINQIELFRLN